MIAQYLLWDPRTNTSVLCDAIIPIPDEMQLRRSRER